jgi:hypothetical protein
MLVLYAFRAYAAIMFMLYAALAMASAFYRGPHYAALAAFALLAVLYAAALVAPRAPWAWTLGLFALAFGVPSLTIVFALPLLMAWLRPTTKAAYRIPP